MNNYNEKKEEKGGFLSALSGLFRGGSSMAGGVSSGGMGSAGGGLAGLFATKAGIVGMVLGGATIAAGVGVVYNFIGPSSKPVYSPELFQNSYYEEESSKAGLERSNSRDASAAASSTLDMFREQAKKDGLGLGGEAAEGSNPNASSEAPAAPADASADAAASAPGADGGAGAGSGGPKLQASAGFGSKGGGGGGGGSSIPRMQSGGGLSGGIGAQFGSVYRPPAQANGGKTSAMTASSARVKSSPKYAIPNINKKGAYGQAKFAGKMGAKAAYSADSAGSRTDATNAFSGETTGAGDVGSPGSGAGLGGAGVSNGQGLKGSDPSLNSNQSTPPKVPTPEDVDPWQAEEDAAMNGMMWAGGLILVAKGLSMAARKLATTVWGAPYAAAVFYAAMAAAAAAIVFALKVVMAGYKMYSQYGQKMMGGIYIVTGLFLIYQAYQALMSAYEGADRVGDIKDGGKMTNADWKQFDKGEYVKVGK